MQKRGEAAEYCRWRLARRRGTLSGGADRRYDARGAVQSAMVLAVLEQAMSRLRDEYNAPEKQKLFAGLKRSLMGDLDAVSYAELGGQLGSTEGAVRRRRTVFGGVSGKSCERRSHKRWPTRSRFRRKSRNCSTLFRTP